MFHVIGMLPFLSRRCVSTLSKIRNVGIIAHIDAGKTTTTERMLYYSGAIKRIGNVDTMDTVTDFLDAERERGITIQSAAVTFNWNNHQINLIDTPGHVDFNYEVIRSLRVLDGCVTILDSVSGVEALTEKVWKLASELKIPRIVYINKMDRPGAGFGRTVREVVSRLKTKVVLPILPYFKNDDLFCGVIDVLNMVQIEYVSEDGKEIKATPAEESENKEIALQGRQALIDQLSELDETVLNEFVENETVSTESLTRAIRRLTIEGEIVPVICGSSFRNMGIQPLMEACVSYLPSPESTLTPKPAVPNGLLSMLAFKVRHDPQRGVMVFVRVYTGQLKKNSMLFNTTSQEKERVSKVLRMQADEPVEQDSFGPGEIAVLLGTKNIRTGDTLIGGNKLSNDQKQLQLQSISGPPPVFFIRISPLNVGNLRGMKAALDILLREDPSLSLSYDEDAGQYLLAGMGELHLEIATNRLIEELGAKVSIGDVMITLKEAVDTSAIRPDPVFKREVDHMDAETVVSVKIVDSSELGADTDTDTEMEGLQTLADNNNVLVKFKRHPTIRNQAVEKEAIIGLNPVIAMGGRRGHALMNTNIVCEVSISPESQNISLVAPLVRAAATEAIANIDSSNFTLLEPLMNVHLTIPENCAGTIIADLTSNRRGIMKSLDDTGLNEQSDRTYIDMSTDIWTPTDHTMYMSKHADTKNSSVQVNALVPLRKMVGYLSVLRSATQGRGTFEMEFAQFDAVPAQDVDDVLEQSS